MDLSKLNRRELFGFLESKGFNPEKFDDDGLYYLAQNLLDQLSPDQLNFDTLTPPLVNLYLANLFKQNVTPETPRYKMTELMSIDYQTIYEIGNAFQIPHPPADQMGFTDLEFLRTRVIRVAELMGILIQDVIDENKPHVEVWYAQYPINYYPGITVKEFLNPPDQLTEGNFREIPMKVAVTQQLAETQKFYFPELTTYRKHERQILTQLPNRIYNHLVNNPLPNRTNGPIKGDIIQNDRYKYLAMIYNGYNFESLYHGDQVNFSPNDVYLPSKFSHPEFPLGYFYIRLNEHFGKEYHISRFPDWGYCLNTDLDAPREWIDQNTLNQLRQSEWRGPIGLIFDELDYAETGQTPIQVTPGINLVFRTSIIGPENKIYNFQIDAETPEQLQTRLNESKGAIRLSRFGYFKLVPFEDITESLGQMQI